MYEIHHDSCVLVICNITKIGRGGAQQKIKCVARACLLKEDKRLVNSKWLFGN